MTKAFDVAPNIVVPASLLEDGSPLVTDLVREFERARCQWDEFQQTGVSTAHVGSYDLCFSAVLKKHLPCRSMPTTVSEADFSDILSLIPKTIDRPDDGKGLASQIMDAAWPMAGGNHQPADFWWAVAFAANIAERMAGASDIETLPWIDGIGDAPHASTVLATYLDKEVGEWIVQLFVAERPSAPFTHWMHVTRPDERVVRAPQTDGEIAIRFVKDAIRSAYDRGYNDARLPLNLPRDNAPGCRGREKSDEIANDVLARLRRLEAKTPPPPAPRSTASLDKATIDRVAAALDGADVSFKMNLTRLVDGVSTYTLTMDGKTEEFGDTDDLYDRVREIKHRKQAEAVISALAAV